jgi:hypothetical protein
LVEHLSYLVVVHAGAEREHEIYAGLLGAA